MFRTSGAVARVAKSSLQSTYRPASVNSTRTLTSSTPRAVSDVAEQLRQVMRNVPQPVAIASTVTSDSSSTYHGATLSSFTPITLHPHPLIAFSLNLPSRLADQIRPIPLPATSSDSPDDVTPTLTPDPLAPLPQAGKRLNIALLSTPHAEIAKNLSQRGSDHSSLFSASPFQPSPTGLPILPDAIGNLTCEVVSSVSLRDMGASIQGEEVIDFDDEVEGGGLKPLHPDQRSVVGGLVEPQPGEANNDAINTPDGKAYGSELFICRVLGVTPGTGGDSPLLYLRRQYTTAKGV